MEKIIFEKSDTEFYTAQSGLALVGLLINEYTDLRRKLNRLPGDPSVKHADVVTSYLGLLCNGKGYFEAMDTVRGDDWFKRALGLKRIPSKETLRQRFDRMAPSFDEAVQESSVEMLEAVGAPLSAVSTGHIPLDMDVFPMTTPIRKRKGCPAPTRALTVTPPSQPIWARRVGA